MELLKNTRIIGAYSSFSIDQSVSRCGWQREAASRCQFDRLAASQEGYGTLENRCNSLQEYDHDASPQEHDHDASPQAAFSAKVLPGFLQENPFDNRVFL